MHKIFTFFIISALLVAILSEIPHSYSDDAKTLVFKAKAFATYNRLEDAFSYYDNALKIDPNNQEAKQGKDNTYNSLKPIQDKLSEADGKLKNDQYNLYWNLQKATLLSGIGKYREAVPYIEKVAQIDSGPNILVQEYQIFDYAGEYDKALSVVDKLISNPPLYRGESLSEEQSNIDVFNVWKSITLYKLGKYKEANELLNLNGVSPNVNPPDSLYPFYLYVFKGLILEKLGLKDAANQFYQSNSEDLNTMKGITLFSARAYGEAIPYLEKTPLTSSYYESVSYMKVIAYDEISESNPIGQFSPSTGSDFFDSLTKFFKNLFQWK